MLLFAQPDVKLMQIQQFKFPWTVKSMWLTVVCLEFTNFHHSCFHPLPVFTLGYVTEYTKCDNASTPPGFHLPKKHVRPPKNSGPKILSFDCPYM